jgi:hypothetical protein
MKIATLSNGRRTFTLTLSSKLKSNIIIARSERNLKLNGPTLTKLVITSKLIINTLIKLTVVTLTIVIRT